MNDITTWLYSKNAAFWTDKTGSPANYDEIISNLRAKYGVTDLPFRWRIILSLVTFVIALVLILVLCLLITFIVGHLSDGTLSISEFFLNLIGALAMALGAYLFSIVTFDLIAHRQAAVEKSWADLLSKGILLEGKVTLVENQKGGERKLKYQFFDADGKRRSGYYFLTRARDAIEVGDKVAVWYVRSRLHTLL